jgi:hypothetical protein
MHRINQAHTDLLHYEHRTALCVIELTVAAPDNFIGDWTLGTHARDVGAVDRLFVGIVSDPQSGVSATLASGHRTGLRMMVPLPGRAITLVTSALRLYRAILAKRPMPTLVPVYG